jgi:hypothetical protein
MRAAPEINGTDLLDAPRRISEIYQGGSFICNWLFMPFTIAKATGSHPVHNVMHLKTPHMLCWRLIE